MWDFALFIVVGLAAVVLATAKLRGAAVGTAILAALILVWSMTTAVGSREVGIVTSLGKYSSTEGPGLHVVAPWSSTERFTTRVQSLDRKKTCVVLAADAALGDTAEAKSLSVPGGGAAVKATVRWAIDGTEKAKELWRQYKDFETVQNKLVAKESDASIQEVLGGRTAAAAVAGSNRRSLGRDIGANLQKVLDRDGIKVASVTVTDVDLDPAVDARLKQLAASSAQLVQQQIATKVATEQAKTRSASRGTLTVEQEMRYRCLEALATAAARGSIAGAPSCFGGPAAPVIVGK